MQATPKSVKATPRLISIVLIGRLFLSTDVAAKPGAEAGVLTCHSLPNTKVNLLLYSSVDVRCVFKTSQGEENYRGKTGIGPGVDFAWRPELEMIFAVLMTSSDVAIGSHALAGSYGGANASPSLGASSGASVLVGGGAKNISLQPVAIEAGTGVGVTAGLKYLVLEPVPYPQAVRHKQRRIASVQALAEGHSRPRRAIPCHSNQVASATSGK